jgi:hypothetical protein
MGSDETGAVDARSRADVLKLAGAGVLGAVAASAALPDAASAGTGDPLLIGENNGGLGPFTWLQGANNDNVLTLSQNSTGKALICESSTGSAIHAGTNDKAGIGVEGHAPKDGISVLGSNYAGPSSIGATIGVNGFTDDPDGGGVVGENSGGGAGVWGISNSANALQPPAIYAQNTSTGFGLTAESNGGAAVHAHDLSTSDTAYGVYAESDSGVAVQGITSSGAALAGEADSTAGVGLLVRGRAVYSNCGIAIVHGSKTTTKSSVRVSNVALTSASLVLATIQTSNAPGTFVQSAVPNVANSWVTISLNQPVSVPVKVAWFVVELIPASPV